MDSETSLQRKKNEAMNLFSDPKFSRQAWKGVGLAILQHPATAPVPSFDKNGVPTADYQAEKYAYDALTSDIDSILHDGERAPTMLEMIMYTQAIRARTDVAAATFIRDTVGAKPIDESKILQANVNVYENLTDEELELLAEHRASLASPIDNSPETAVIDNIDEETTR